MRLGLASALEAGMLRTSATLEDPDVRLAPWPGAMPIVWIEEAGIVIELEFTDREALDRFQRRVADLRPLEPDRG